MLKLNSLEEAVLEKLLDGDHPVLEQLRRQLRVAGVIRRELSGVGFFATLDVQGAPPANDLNVRLTDVGARISGVQHGAGFILFVNHGRIDMLEGYTLADPWPDEVTAFALYYLAGRPSVAQVEQRDMAQVARDLG